MITATTMTQPVMIRLLGSLTPICAKPASSTAMINTPNKVLIIAVLEAGLAQIGVSDPSKRIITGCVIVVAVIIDTLRQKRSSAA